MYIGSEGITAILGKNIKGYLGTLDFIPARLPARDYISVLTRPTCALADAGQGQVSKRS